MDCDLLNENEFRLFKSNDKHVFKKVYDKYFGLIHYIAGRCGAESHLCDDIAQETFIRLLKHTAQIKDQVHIKNWLCMTARNITMDQVRKQKVENKYTQQKFEREQQKSMNNQSEPGHKNVSLTSDSDVHELELTLIGELIDKVTIDTKDDTFSLFYRDGLSAKEIATKNNTPVSTVTNRLSRLRKRFKICFEEHIKLLHDEIL